MNKMPLQEMKSLKSFIKQVLAEAISEDGTYKNKIKSLFEDWIKKFSASYINYREQNYPQAWLVTTLLYAEDYKHQYIDPLFNERSYKDYFLITEHKGFIYVINSRARGEAGSLVLGLAVNITCWHKQNWLFKLSISDFETAVSVADTYEEFLALCEQMNVIHDEQEDE